MTRMSKTAPAKVNASLRRREAAELRARKLTWEEVATRMGISETRARQLYNEFVEQFTDENKQLADAIRDEQLNEIRLLKNTWLPVVLDSGASPKHVEAYIKLMVHESNLGGAKAPAETKTTLQGPDGGPVQTVGATLDLTKLDSDKLAMLHALLQDLHATGSTSG